MDIGAKARPGVLAGAVAAGLALGGCSASVHATVYGGGSSIPAGTVENAIKTQDATTPGSITDASCPSDLALNIGTSENCTITNAQGQRALVRVTITSVSGSTAHFHFHLIKTL